MNNKDVNYNNTLYVHNSSQSAKLRICKKKNTNLYICTNLSVQDGIILLEKVFNK